MANTISCYLLGEGTLLIQCAEVLLGGGHAIHGVISSEPAVVRWASGKGIPRIAASEDQVAFLGRQPFDYLFSIINHSITAGEVLRLPRRGAINFHDAPLPRYAGFNATSWAILAGEAAHGVTWHEMSEHVDACLKMKRARATSVAQYRIIFCRRVGSSRLASVKGGASILVFPKNAAVLASPAWIPRKRA